MSGMAARNRLQCWRCGTDVSAARLPDAREARCPTCEADLHVCRMCSHFVPHLSGQCNEDQAEEVMNKERANFCDWFSPQPGAFAAGHKVAGDSARARLEGLFGALQPPASKAEKETEARNALEALFKKPSE